MIGLIPNMFWDPYYLSSILTILLIPPYSMAACHFLLLTLYRPIRTPEDLAILHSDIDSPTFSIMLFVYLYMQNYYIS